MMQIFVRHGKAAPSDGDDLKRPLLTEGHAEVRRLAQQLAQSFPPPDHLVTSPARRAMATAEGLRAEWIGCPAARIEPLLWGADAVDLQERIPANHLGAFVVFVGHNPGMAELAALLAGADDFPTASALVLPHGPDARGVYVMPRL